MKRITLLCLPLCLPFCLTCSLLIGLLGVVGNAHANDNIATLRGAAIANDTPPPRMSRVDDQTIKRRRNYPMQPPTVPHKVDGYQMDLNANRCMTCHSRRNSEDSQAAMVSVTHYMDRDGNFLAEVSPRRYFCMQCHVIQQQTDAVVGNEFIDMDDLIGPNGSRQ